MRAPSLPHYMSTSTAHWAERCDAAGAEASRPMLSGSRQTIGGTGRRYSSIRLNPIMLDGRPCQHLLAHFDQASRQFLVAQFAIFVGNADVLSLGEHRHLNAG